MACLEHPIRIGQIEFTNVWPVFHFFPEMLRGTRIEMVHQVPTGLNKDMAAGSIDIGAISSFAYAENFADYLLYPHLSVSTYGKVGSILLFHRKPLQELKHATIALPTTSATSVNLLKIVMRRFYDGDPEYCSMQPDIRAMMAEADAALLIGDDAIRAAWMNPPFHVTDLGELWKKHTGCWMVYAVWAIRRETAERRGPEAARIHEAFLNSKARGQLHAHLYADAALHKIGGTLSFWKRYFNGLNHDLGPEQVRGLSLYYQYAYEAGLLDERVPIQLWDYRNVV